ncbi:MAG: APC family permease, partial [Clostridiales bacterium]
MEKSSGSKGLGKLDFFLGMLCIIFFVDTVAPMSAMGVTSITWALIIAVIFYVPSGMITAELATTYPEEGGMYAWVKRAYGKRWGARISYLYWVNNAIWTASVATFFVGLMSSLFFPNLPFVAMLGLMLVCIWAIIFISMRSVDESKWLINITTIVKLSIGLGLILSAVAYLVMNGSPANTFSWAEMKPSLSQSLTFMPALIYNFLGFEAVMTLATHMKNPKKDIPRITIFSSILVASIYIITSIALLIIIPVGEINLVTGIMDAFFAVLGGSIIGKTVIFIVGILFLFTILTQTSSYLVAACRMAAAASDDGELPKIFGKRHKNHDTPV